jgi:5-methyltetrahydrofolate--homocysteine methyltransferase
MSEMNKDIFQNDELIFLDGAMGTMLQGTGWNSSKPPEVCNMVRPELVEAVHTAYAQAGADIITANTFGANSLKLKPFGYSPEEVIKKAVAIAKKAAGQRLVALDIGPLGQLMAPMGTMSFQDAYEEFALQARAGQEAGADLILIETMSDLYEAKAAVLAAKEQSQLPVVCSLTFQENGRTLMGNDALSVVTVLEGLGVDALGVNCSLGPEELLPVVQQFVKAAHVPVLVQANAGIPELSEGKPIYPLNPESFAAAIDKMADIGVKLLGGCCGTNPDFISTLYGRLQKKKWNKPNNPRITAVASARQTVLLDGGIRIVGQRINPTGRQDIIHALQGEDLNFLYEEALVQKQAGADMLDINVFTEKVNEVDAMKAAVEFIQSMIPLPLQISSENYKVLEAGARFVNGKPILNSVNGSKQSMEEILPLASKYGACVIALTYDEEGIPESAEGRLAIAEKILDNALSYGIKKQDLIIDCIVEDAARQPGKAEITLRALSLVKQELDLQTILGISDISRGMENRPALNAVFLAMALGAGLDCAIVDPVCQKVADTIKRYRMITEGMVQ